jgi:two-component system, NarL family, sensor histidine kinase DegS
VKYSRRNELLRRLGAPAIVQNNDGLVIAANAAMCRATGYSRRALLTMESTDLVSSTDSASRDSSSRPDILLTPGLYRLDLHRKDGSRVPVRGVVEALDSNKDSRDSLITIMGLAHPGARPNSLLSDDGTPIEKYTRSLEPAAILIDVKGKVAFANPKCCELLGFEEDMIVGKHWSKVLLAPRYRRRGRQHFDDLIMGKERPRGFYETTSPTKEGISRTIRWVGITVLKDHLGESLGVFGYGSDKTEEARAKQALRDRDEIYRLLSENSTDAIWVSDMRGKVSYMSPSVVGITGFTCEEVLNTPFMLRLTPSSYTTGMKALEHQLEMEKDPRVDKKRAWDIELEMLRKDGSAVWIEAKVSFIRDAQDRPIGLYGSTRDITERKKAELLLVESERRYRMLFENSRDAIGIVARDGTILDLNSSALDLFGYSRSQAGRLNMQDIMSERQWSRVRRQIESRGYIRDYVTALRCKDGSHIDCVLTFDLRRDSRGDINGYEGSIRDITEWLHLQRNLRVYTNEVTRAQENERLRVSRELHDGPLQEVLTISLDIEAAIKRQALDHDSRVRDLELIKNRINSVAEDIVWTSHSLRPSVLDHLGFLPAVRVLVKDFSDTTRIETRINATGKLRRLSPDAELGLFRIVQEALNNVRKHSGATRVAVDVAYMARSVRVSITDNGKGFEVPRVLGDLASSGMLGLVGMQERAQLIDGRLMVDSDLGVGTKIAVVITGP